MSLTAIVPTIDYNLQHREISLISPQEFTTRTYPSTSYSQNNATFSIIPPNTSTFIDRCMYMSLPVTITYAGTTTGSALLQSGYDALRSRPLASILANLQFTIDNQTFTFQPYELIHIAERYEKPKIWSLSPMYLDQYQVYADGVGSNNNSLGSYLDSTMGKPLRGAFPMTITNGATSSTISTIVTEPLYVPPLTDEVESSLGFTNVQQLSVVANYITQLNRIVSHAASLATLSSVTVTLGQPSIYMKFYTPPHDYIPRPMSYGSQQIAYFTTPSATLTTTSTATIASTNMQLNCVPSHMYIAVREANANLTYTSSDTFLNISGLNITFNNKTGILSTASEYDLFAIAKSNGLCDTWEGYHGTVTSATLTQIGTCGSVIRLNFGKDIPLIDGSYVGMNGAFNMQMNVSVKNVSSQTITTPTLYVVVVYPTTLNIDTNGLCSVKVGLSNDSNGEYVSYHDMKKYYGAGFKDFISKVASYVKPAVDWLRKNKVISNVAGIVGSIPSPISGIANVVSSGAKNLGFGMVGNGNGGMLMGGEQMTTQSLRERMKRV